MLHGSRVFGAFHTVSHRVLEKVSISHDVLAAGGEDGKTQLFELIRAMNLRPIHAGPLAVSGLLERMTALLISINKQNKVRESGIHIVGIPD